ncbi:MAG: ATP-binding cassette domain-containing protein [Lachnospiraceae bacterium]|nr:ATP-binding cassette domain-containing protein [Lachnospiraceae bacterium]
MILSVSDLTKTFSDRVLLNGISFHINDNEKAALIGVNGVGKTTLSRIITGRESFDSGSVTVKKDASIGYLSQHEELESERTVLEEMLLAKAFLIEEEKRLSELHNLIAECDDEDRRTSYLKEFDRLQHDYELNSGFSYRSEVTGALKGLGFSEEEFERPVSSFSGGQKTRLALGRLILSEPDLLILDEPTNHLDMKGTLWLEGYVSSYRKAVLLISHDRYFLDKCVNTVFELSKGSITRFDGNYSSYVEKKQALNQQRIKEYQNNQREIRHQEEVIEKLKSFNREKSIKRAESREKMLKKIDVVERPDVLEKRIHFRLKPRIESGNTVLTVRDLEKSYGGHSLFKGLFLEIKKGERVGIIGENGIGKTTLMKCICGVVRPENGRIEPGSKVNIGYYDQEQQALDDDKTVFEEISDAYPDLDNTQIRNTLASFLFLGDDVFKKISALSGGERGRLCLARLMLSDANFLILDEPTNHLDIDSKEVLEAVLRDYEGTVLFVSHDRYFINSVATRLFNMTEDGIYCYEGNYDFYLEHVDNPSATLSSVNKKTEDTAETAEIKTSKQDFEEQKRLQSEKRKLEARLKKCEGRIDEIEARLSFLDSELTREEVYTNTDRLLEIQNEKKELEDELGPLMETWEELFKGSDL